MSGIIKMLSINLNEPIKALWNKVTNAEEKKKLKELLFTIQRNLQTSITAIELCKYEFNHFEYTQLEDRLESIALNLDELSCHLSERLNFENTKPIYEGIQELVEHIKK